MNKQGKMLLRSGIALSLLTSTLLHATNGDTLIAAGAKARGMGGVGIAMSHGAESALNNPALITSVKNTEISFGGTLFMPNVSANGEKSDADTNVIPEVSIAHKINENWYTGIGIWGTAGMGVDYRDSANPQLDSMVTNLQLMQFGVPLAYKADNFSIGFAPILQYGALDISYGALAVPTGVSQDFGFGFSLGMTYDVTENFTIGAVYKSAIKMTYNQQLTTSGMPADDLEQPVEMGVGVAYNMNEHTVAVDYKKIKWSDAKGYDLFNWQDQTVVAVGYQYERDNYAVRLGYNHASSPIEDTSAQTNWFNLVGFPATVESHYTVGMTYDFSETFSLDLAYVRAAETSDTLNTVAGPITAEHSQDSISFQLTYAF